MTSTSGWLVFIDDWSAFGLFIRLLIRSASKAVFRHELQRMSWELCPDFLQMFPFTHEQRSRRFSDVFRTTQESPGLWVEGWCSRQRKDISYSLLLWRSEVYSTLITVSSLITKSSLNVFVSIFYGIAFSCRDICLLFIIFHSCDCLVVGTRIFLLCSLDFLLPLHLGPSQRKSAASLEALTGTFTFSLAAPPRVAQSILPPLPLHCTHIWIKVLCCHCHILLCWLICRIRYHTYDPSIYEAWLWADVWSFHRPIKGRLGCQWPL